MSKARSHLADYAVYLLVRGFVCFIQILSWEGARKFARCPHRKNLKCDIEGLSGGLHQAVANAGAQF